MGVSGKDGAEGDTVYYTRARNTHRSIITKGESYTNDKHQELLVFIVYSNLEIMCSSRFFILTNYVLLVLLMLGD